MNHQEYYDAVYFLSRAFRDSEHELSDLGCAIDDISIRLYGIFQDCRRILEDRLLRGEDVDD